MKDLFVVLDNYRDCGEGPFDTRMFAATEVGVPYLIILEDGKWYVYVKKEIA